jgi:hypothetical protein
MTQATEEPQLDAATRERLLLDILCQRIEADGPRAAMRNLFDFAEVYLLLEQVLWHHMVEHWHQEKLDAEEAC